MEDEYSCRIAGIGKAISDPCRVRILLNFRGRTLTISTIVEELETYQSNVSYHISVLARAGLVDRIDDGRWHYYALSRNAMDVLSGFVEDCEGKDRRGPGQTVLNTRPIMRRMMGIFCPRCRSLVPPGADRCGTCGAGMDSMVESSQSVLDGVAPRPAAPAVCGRRNPDAPYMPYEPRKNQLVIIEEIVRALDEGRHFVMESGTGTGKTVVALAAALDHASRTGKKVVFLTRTNSQCDQVMRELRAISQIPGVRTLTGVPVVGRGRSCPLFRGVKDYDSIPSNVLTAMCNDAKQKSARGQAGGCRYFDRVEYSLPGIRSYVQTNLPTSSDLDAYCVRMQVCPYEAKKALMKDAQVVAAPYVHILDPDIREGFLSNLGCPGDPKGLLIIVDEAHNFIDSARDSESASMGRDLVDAAIDECTTFTSEPRIGETGLRDLLSFLKATMRGLAADRVGLAGHGASEVTVEGPVLENALMERFSLTRESLDAFVEDMEEIGEQRTKRLVDAGGRRISEIQQVAEFLRKWFGASGGRYVRSVSVDADGERLHAHCMDPSDISDFLNSTKGTVHMSGTLQPLDQYARVIGLTGRITFRTYPSPFPAENRLVLYDETVTMQHATLGSDPDMQRRIQERIADLCNAVDKNTLVLFTSYRHMNNMRGYLEGHIRKRMYWERSGDARGNSAALASFRSRRDGVLFCVMGGNFAEGIDFPGEELCFAVIVGIPYPPPSVVQTGMSDMFDARFGQGKGWTYCSHVPAQRKIAQAIGRLIRTETDRGAAVILDRRAERMGRDLGARPTTDPVGEVAAFFRRCTRDEYRNGLGRPGSRCA